MTPSEHSDIRPCGFKHGDPLPDEAEQGDTHVDRVRLYPFGGLPTLIERVPSLDDPRIGGQERAHWATYVDVSEPHTMADCPFDAGGKRK